MRIACKSGRNTCCFLRVAIDSGARSKSCDARFALARFESDDSVLSSSCSSVVRFFASES